MSEQGKVVEAAAIAEDVAELLDRAFDWDCLVVAEARKEVSDCKFVVGEGGLEVVNKRMNH